MFGDWFFKFVIFAVFAISVTFAFAAGYGAGQPAEAVKRPIPMSWTEVAPPHPSLLCWQTHAGNYQNRFKHIECIPKPADAETTVAPTQP